MPVEVFVHLAAHPFEGNVRELINVARALAIDGIDRPAHEVVASVRNALGPRAVAPEVQPAATVARPPAQIGDDDLLAALARNGWRMAAAARDLGIARSSIYLLVDACARIRKVGEFSDGEIALAVEAARGDLERAAAELQVSPRALRRRGRQD